jgi:small subunit ribosomal protein S16
MLAIRLQRQGRKDYATYRFIVQDAKLSPASGRVIARIGSYNPHTKEVNLDKEKAKFYLDNGAQPSDTIARIFKGEKIKLPAWVEAPIKQKRKMKNAEKLRKNRPKQEKPAEEPKAEEQTAQEPKQEDKPAEETTEEPKNDEEKAEDKPDQPAEDEKPAEESKPEEKQETPESKDSKEEPKK